MRRVVCDVCETASYKDETDNLAASPWPALPPEGWAEIDLSTTVVRKTPYQEPTPEDAFGEDMDSEDVDSEDVDSEDMDSELHDLMREEWLRPFQVRTMLSVCPACQQDVRLMEKLHERRNQDVESTLGSGPCQSTYVEAAGFQRGLHRLPRPILPRPIRQRVWMAKRRMAKRIF